MKADDLKLFGLLVLFQSAIFCWHYHREVSWDIPINSDQAAYLARSYRLQYDWSQNGWQGFRQAAHDLIVESPNGFGLPMEGEFLSFLRIGVRFPRMLVNLIALLAMEFFAFTALVWLTSNRLWGWASLGLIMTQNTAWDWAGGMFDFRPDFAAYCLYGIWTCIVLRSNVFLSTRWSLASSAACFILIINRYVASVYVGGVMGVLGIALAAMWFFARTDRQSRDAIRKRLINFLIANVLVAVAIAPFFWMSWHSIYNYYFVGHLLGPEGIIRMHQAGIHNWWTFVMFYPRSIIGEQLQVAYLRASAIMLFVAALARWMYYDPCEPPVEKSKFLIQRRFIQYAFIAAAIIVPVLALTADPSKSAIVGGIVCIPIAALTCLVAAQVCGAFKSRQQSIIMGIGVCVALMIGVQKTENDAQVHTGDFAFKDDVRQLIAAGKSVSELSRQLAWDHPRLSFDVVSPYLGTNVFTCIAFENGQRPLAYQTMLGGSILAFDRDSAYSQLANSDFVFLTTIPKKGFYPFYDSMKELEPDIDSWVKSHLTKEREFDFQGSRVTLYVRPAISVNSN